MSDADPVTAVTGSGIPMRGNDIDTDQIIPARYLKWITFEGLGRHVFQDQRFDDDGNPVDHPFNDDRFQDSSILVVNSNFGCGSSREHAPQALMRWGIEAIVGESFGEIFAGNCLALGIPTATVDSATAKSLQDWIDDNPDVEIHFDVEAGTLTYGDSTIDVEIDPAQRKALVGGEWDTTALLRSNMDRVHEVAVSLPYTGVE